jgi:hypothetical protein
VQAVVQPSLNPLAPGDLRDDTAHHRVDVQPGPFIIVQLYA